MSGATHIVGGFVFAGTLCSFTDVNIFENPYYIGVCVLFSLLPDIDTTKSWIGFALYPFAWLIYHKFGHRTVTHSLLFFIAVWLATLALIRFGFIADKNFLKIILFSLFGHYVFDMITVSGVPLFYPFLKNPCVIPGNPAYRFNTGCVRSELIVIGICGILCFTMQPLFAQGFWASYNRQFATVKHVDRENQNTEFYIICEFDYVLNAENFVGEAIVIDSKTNELILFDHQNVFSLNTDNPQLKINHTRPRVSTIEKRFEEYQFYDISYDSLQSMLRGKLASGLIQSNKNVRYIDNAITYNTNFIKFANRFDFQIFATYDSVKLTIEANIARLEATINQSQLRHQQEVSRWLEYQQSVLALEDSLANSSLSNYERNRLVQQLIRLRNRPIERPIYQPPAAQIAELDIQKRALVGTPLTFSGYMTVLTFGFDPSSTNPQIAEPIYSGSHLLANFHQYPISDKYANE